MKRFGVREAALILTILVLFAVCIHHQTRRFDGWHEGSGKYIQKVNIPNADVIRIATLGYDTLYADFLTLRAIQAFGAAWDTEDQSIEPIANYFDILTTLDPHFVEVYELGHLVIGDDHREHEVALDLVRKGSEWNWREWRIPYLGIYTTLWDMDSPERAEEFLLRVRRTRDTPEHVLRMDEYVARQSGRYEIAFDMNLQHFIRYTQLEMEPEQGVAIRKFQSILDPWYRTELAREAQRFLDEQGRYPVSFEEMMAMGYTPRFSVPTMDSIIAALERYMDEPGDLMNYQDQIRQASFAEIEGLPADPFGYWYFISTPLREQRELAYPDPNAGLRQQHDYIVTPNDILELQAEQARRVVNSIFASFNQTNELPTYDEIGSILIEDQLGGHWVYKDDTGSFFSTSNLRLGNRWEATDPRMGFAGTIDDLPARTFVVTDDQTPHLPTEPDIWDYEVDALWAICKGLIPGVPFYDQPAELLARARSVDGEFIQCSDHVEDPAAEDLPAGGLPEIDAEPLASAPSTVGQPDS